VAKAETTSADCVTKPLHFFNVPDGLLSLVAISLKQGLYQFEKAEPYRGFRPQPA
jgi:hypothetical protein